MVEGRVMSRFNHKTKELSNAIGFKNRGELYNTLIRAVLKVEAKKSDTLTEDEIVSLWYNEVHSLDEGMRVRYVSALAKKDMNSKSTSELIQWLYENMSVRQYFDLMYKETDDTKEISKD